MKVWQIVKKIFKWVAKATLGVILLFLLLATALYLPPVQQFLKNRTTSYLSRQTGMQINIDRVRLSFPLDLLLDRMSAVDRSDTVAAADQLLLDVKIMPLLSGNIELNGFELRQAKINTKNLVSDLQVKGQFGLLAIRKPAVCNLGESLVDINKLQLRDARVSVILSDTARQDTTTSQPSPWKVKLNRAELTNTRLYLQMPGDSMRIAADVRQLALNKTLLDLPAETYRIDNIELNAHDLRYDIPYQPRVKVMPGKNAPIDFNHLQADIFSLAAQDFEFTPHGINVKLDKLALIEQSGLTVNKFSATLHYDSTRIDMTGARLVTPSSEVNTELHLPLSALQAGNTAQAEIKLQAAVGKQDIGLLSGGQLDGLLAKYPNKSLEIKLRATGHVDDARIDYCNVTLPDNLDLRLSGSASMLASDKQRRGKLHYSASLNDINFINGLIPNSLRSTVHLPNGIRLGGDVALDGTTLRFSQNAIYLGKGKLSFSGNYSPKTNAYSARLEAQQFPLKAFLPGMEFAPLTARVEVKGHGTDFLHRGTSLNGGGKIEAFAFNGIPLDKTTLDARINGTRADIAFMSDNSWLQAAINLSAEIVGNETRLSLNGNIDNLATNLGRPYENDQQQAQELFLMMGLRLDVTLNSKARALTVDGSIDPFNAATASRGYPGGNLHVYLATNPDSTRARIASGDMTLRFDSRQQISDIISKFGNYATTLTNQLAAAQINQDSLKSLLPDTRLYLEATQANPLQQYLALKGYSFDSLYADISTNHVQGINANVNVTNFKTGSVLFEQSEIKILQNSDALKLHAAIKNSKRKNPNRFSAQVDGSLLANGFSVLANFIDENGREGLNIGTRATFDQQGGISFKLIPETSVLAYRKFKVNPDNHITLSPEKRLTANVNLVADDNTALKLYSIPTDTVTKQDITLTLTHLSLRDLSNVLPFMPRMSGFLNGDIHVLKQDSDMAIVSAIEAKDLVYEDSRIGTLGTELFYMPDEDGHYVMAQIICKNQDIAVLDGRYSPNDSLNATLRLNDMPCELISTFISNDGTLGLKGKLNGDINVAGFLDNLQFNGEIQPDSVHAYSDLYSFDLKMENKSIFISNGKIALDNIAFYTTGTNPLYIDGDIDFSDLGNMVLNLSIKAKDFELINAKKTKKSMTYGKVFVDVDATVKGKSDFIVLRGKLKVLDQTDVTYVMTDTPLQVEDQFAGLVEFTNFSEPDEKEETPTPIGGTFINLDVNISEDAHLHCELSPDGKSYVDCNGGGDLTLQVFPSGDIAVQGRFNINSGEMKYTLPFIPLKTFSFTDGNHIIFNGDPANPVLNITALETTRAAVTDDNGGSRMVTFKVGVAITRQLSDMGLEFIIDAPEDSEVQNELATMSAENKSRLAITMLATGMYASTNNKAGFRATNALNAFLENEIQNIAGNALKTIDLSVGVEDNTTNTGDIQTDYTFKFSKKLWNDRITFLIGGKVSTGAGENQSSTQSFIDNISLEYRLDKKSTRYIRIFYDNDTYDPLEGNYSSAGAGYILRRKTNSFGDLLIFRKKKNEKTTK